MNVHTRMRALKIDGESVFIDTEEVRYNENLHTVKRHNSRAG
jgi:hypothetical protein